MKRTNSNPVRIAYLVSHPIQYQTPLLRRIATESEFDLTVFFRSDFSTKEFIDPGFGRSVKWDVSLLGGYVHEILPAFGAPDRLSFWRPLNHGLWQRLKKGRFHVLWIHGYVPFFNLYAMIAAKLLGIKVLIRSEATLVSKKRGKLKKVAKRVFFFWIKLLCDGFLAIGTMNKEYYLTNGVPVNKIFEMPYAVDNDFFKISSKLCRLNQEKLRSKIGLSIGRPVFLYAAKLSERKRPMDLLEAFSQVINKLPQRPYLLFIGDGELRSKLEKKVSELGLEYDVFFLGFRNQSELPSYYGLCDVFVLPSIYEPWGLVINEAMNAGRAVIASDRVGCAPDLIHSGVNGFTFQAGNIQDLASTLSKAISPSQRCRSMGKASLEIISRWGFDEDIKALKNAVSAVILNNSPHGADIL